MFSELVAPLLNTEMGKRASFGALALGSLLFLSILINNLVDWKHDFTLVHVKANTTRKTFVSDDIQTLITGIPGSHLFGKPGEQNAVLPITSLQLRLLGVNKSTPENFSRVIISEAGQPGKVYKVNDMLSSGVKIQAITSYEVVLENGGRLEKLPLQRMPLAFQGLPKPLMLSEEK